MKAILCAAGQGSRWNNYTGRRKHLLRIDGESLIHRTIRQLRDRGVTDIVVECHHDHQYTLDVPTITGVDPTDVFIGRKVLVDHFNIRGATLVLLADAYFSDAAMDIVVGAGREHPADAFFQIGRLKASDATGKPGPEMFGWVLGSEEHENFLISIEICQNAQACGKTLYNDWSIYQAMAGRKVTATPSEIAPGACHIELPDDGTDDFDFPDDYERWMFHQRRSARRVHEADFSQPWFARNTGELARAYKLHRKLWEHCSIAQAYRDRIGRGGAALGFGVGKEPLPAWLAAQGATVTATDSPAAGLWVGAQHAAGVDDLAYQGICSRAIFERQVKYAPVDMNKIPEEYHGRFDFTWSSSCFEHLGSLRHGLRFFLEQMKCLRQGGIAVHTTEYNIASNEATMELRDLSIFRVRDLIELTHAMQAQGDRLWPIDLTQGEGIADAYVDKQPFRIEPHLNLELGGHSFTSVLLIGARGI